MVDFLALSKREAAEYEPEEAEACISIVSPEAEHPDLSDYFWGVLKLKFHDVDEIYFKRLDEQDAEISAHITPFSLNHAQQILDFWDGRKHDIDRLVVHCEAGVSRSVGVVRALKVLDGKDQVESSSTLRKYGNIFVRNKILEAAGESWEDHFVSRFDSEVTG